MIKTFKLLGILFAGFMVILVIFFVSMFFVTKGEYSVAQTVEFDNSIPHIKIGDTVFHAETFGSDSNKVVIILHGGPGNDYRYLLPLEPLSDKYFVVFYDQRGTGLSPRVKADEQSLENSLKDLANIIDYYAPEKKVNLIGHSWGAMLASGYIAKNPERVNKVVLAEPGMLTTEKAKEYMELFKIKLGWDGLKETIQIIFECLHIKNADSQARIDYIFGKVTEFTIF